MIFFRTIIFWISLSLSAIFFSSIIILLFPFFLLTKSDRKFLHKISIMWARSIFYLNPWWRIKITGLQHIPENQAFIITANHSSQSDILVGFLLGCDFRWLSKASVFRIPWMGWAMWCVGYIGIERGDLKSHQKSMEKCRSLLRSGTSLFFFPEGTRSRNGVIGKFKLGAFKLANDTSVKIVPVTLNGTQKMLPKGSVWVHPSNIDIVVHAAIEPQNISPEDLLEKTREVVRSGLPAELQGRT